MYVDFSRVTTEGKTLIKSNFPLFSRNPYKEASMQKNAIFATIMIQGPANQSMECKRLGGARCHLADKNV